MKLEGFRVPSKIGFVIRGFSRVCAIPDTTQVMLGLLLRARWDTPLVQIKQQLLFLKIKKISLLNAGSLLKRALTARLTRTLIAAVAPHADVPTCSTCNWRASYSLQIITHDKSSSCLLVAPLVVWADDEHFGRLLGGPTTRMLCSACNC